mmetsp:Transcript_65334/g.156181  ORF Transcript_65334/g.156181 Transcript_65334/m.156181 type:complete len:478 (+) Transcript_65334:114-1547(+)|eukprot:CAMPEP_0178428828 /NCGR_PEP_ID=MMETSP0689_2-20121128/30485_1 /TAXON_ID=160604 /ORGANISM="Amphidinium massartii, Strain CS-259" /LENGTH=477 /DNA_ID=CAMNT_0020050625 /DNA_START=33 /DNA_END=1466 /DNA_ORIENTATION=-
MTTSPELTAVRRQVADAVFRAQESGLLASALQAVTAMDVEVLEPEPLEASTTADKSGGEAGVESNGVQEQGEVLRAPAAVQAAAPPPPPPPAPQTSAPPAPEEAEEELAEAALPPPPARSERSERKSTIARGAVPAGEQTQRQARSATIPVLLKSTKQRQLPDQSKEEFLGKLSHLHMEHKGLEVLGDMLAKVCSRIRVLYLGDNRLHTLGPLPATLEILQLPGNQLREMATWSSDLPKLQVLDIRSNRLSAVEGLKQSRLLRELLVSGQQMQTKPLRFDEATLSVIGGSLRTLDVARNQLTSLEALAQLHHLEHLDLSQNSCRTVDAMSLALASMPGLLHLTVEGNPACIEVPKWRDEVLLMAKSLRELDGKPIQQGEHVFLAELSRRRRARSRNQSEMSDHRPGQLGFAGGPGRRRVGEEGMRAAQVPHPAMSKMMAAPGSTHLPPLLPPQMGSSGAQHVATMQRLGRTRGHDAI